MQDFETYGVPTFFMTEPVTEQIGGGNVRIWNCVRRNGVLVPVCEVIIHSTDLIPASRIVGDAAEEAFKLEVQKKREALLTAH